MYGVISIPQFLLQALLRGQSQARASVVVDDGAVSRPGRGVVDPERRR